MENLNPNSRCPGRGLNPRPPEYASIVLSNWPRRSMTNNFLLIEILIRVLQRQTVVCEQYPWHQTAIKDVDNWMVKGYRHEFKWKTCPEVHLWHSSLQLLNHFSLSRMKHAAGRVVSEPMAFEAETIQISRYFANSSRIFSSTGYTNTLWGTQTYWFYLEQGIIVSTVEGVNLSVTYLACKGVK
jgi:hypothetical protein